MNACLHFDLPTVDPCTLDELKDLDTTVGGGNFVMLLELFFRLTPPLYQQLLGALESGDCDAVKMHSHKMAGSCGNFGGTRTTRICLDLEKAHHDLAAARSMRPSLEHAFTELCGQLQRELDLCKLP